MRMVGNALRACFCSVAFIFNYRTEQCFCTRLGFVFTNDVSEGGSGETHGLSVTWPQCNSCGTDEPKASVERADGVVTFFLIQKNSLESEWHHLYHPPLTLIILLLTCNLCQLKLYTGIVYRNVNRWRN